MPGMFVMALAIGHFMLLTPGFVHFRMLFMSLPGDSLMGMMAVVFMIHISHDCSDNCKYQQKKARTTGPFILRYYFIIPTTYNSTLPRTARVRLD